MLDIMDFSSDQLQALDSINDFLSEKNKTKAFILRGSAGTGKTTLVRTVLDSMPDLYEDFNLCAPTNKAAKVLSQKTDQHAITLHRLLYRTEEIENEKWLRLNKRRINPDNPTLVIVDEASMIGDKVKPSNELFQSTAMLSDLLEFVFTGHPSNKLIFVGDPCQLPPIDYGIGETAPALDSKYLNIEKKVATTEFELKMVLRQGHDSYILNSATAIRDYLLYNNNDEIKWQAKLLPNPTAAITQYIKDYEQKSDDKVVLLAWTNSDVNWWNNTLRRNLKLDEHPLVSGTRVIVDKNWSDGNSAISKGETGIITLVNQKIESFANLNFVDATIESTDMAGNTFSCNSKVLLDHLQRPKGSLTQDEEKYLQSEAYRTNDRYRETKWPWTDSYAGALRLRYGYAITCHKAQGSEYKNVILHPYYPKDDKRWLYTAITRAKEELYLFKRA